MSQSDRLLLKNSADAAAIEEAGNIDYPCATRRFIRSLSVADWGYAVTLMIAAVYALVRFSAYMDIYEQAILFSSAPAMAWLGWKWRPLRDALLPVSVLSALSIWLYGGELARADDVFLLKYLLSSQSAVLWMGVLFIFSTATYWAGLAMRSRFAGEAGSILCWSAIVSGLVGLLVRWYESYLMGTDIGHIPVSNLYEVFILFALITALYSLYYEEKYETRLIGPFSLLIVTASVFFLFWYSMSRGAGVIEPLVPALQSWWMKVHVPANFVGYGTFALAAMVGIAYLLKAHGLLSDRLPSLEVLDDIMYKAIAVGFAFFTIATILGALWAAEAWGGYWSWDPKETWALIVWLNYAAWLHVRLVKNLRGKVAAWWAVSGLLVTTFAFIGVNMFLSGLHSYGEL